MPQPASTKSLLAFLTIVLASCEIPARAQQIPATPLRTLSAADRSEAKQARDRADLMRAELEKRLPRPTVPSSDSRRNTPDQGELDADIADVTQAYQAVIERYPRTEISAYCATRLAGFYQRLRRLDEAEKILEYAADEFAGTTAGPQAAFEAALFHAQARQDPIEASKWFANVPAPANLSDAEAPKLYLSAQQQLIKGELALGRNNQAEDRLKELKAAFPQYADELSRFYSFEKNALKGRLAVKPAPDTDGMTTPGANRPKDTRPTTDKDIDQPALEESVRRLGHVRAGAETEKAVAELARHGDAAVEEIGRQIADGPTDFGMVHTSVRVLEKVNTEKSRALLKKIAVGEVENPNLRSWAARALINCDPNRARELLSASDRGVLETAINSLRGKGMDQASFDALKPHIESDDPWIRKRTASIMASEAPRGELADQALKCIVKVLVAVEEIPDRDQFDPSSGRLGGYQTTIAEGHYHACAGTLYHVKVENTMLHETAKQLQGRARDAVVLSLAWRHDKSVYEEIIKLAQDKDAGMFRAWAAAMLCEIGTVDDIPFLRNLSETDPLKRSGGGDVLGPRARSNFPVRESAKNAINTFELRAKK